MPRLIINADDFGLTSGVNRAIAEASRAGAITSATLMANSVAFNEAATLAQTQLDLAVGGHIVLVDGTPLSSGLNSLAPGGRFRNSIKDFALAATRNRLAPEEIQRETEAQIRKMQSAGITLTHLDTHKHTHMFSHVLRPVLAAAKACGIRAVRNPFEPSHVWPIAGLLGRPANWIRMAQVTLLSRFARAFQQIVKEAGMSTTSGTVGIIVTGHLNQKLLIKTIQALPEGTWELVCHPGYMDSDLSAAGTRLLESRQVELDALTSEQTRQALANRGIELISYARLNR